ncbi:MULTISPECIES: alpha-ribazole phosphatase family protein [Pseudomonas]|uniref:alpha-ribazole phosphatase family protein n=1 Tax=Pseudomonas TaxID=286 RepID=UPI00257FC7FF|nr:MULTISPECIES: alpha-ribazole phosphatase family protein [Pseudomonas]
MSLFLLRHGETQGPGGFRGRLDHPLSEQGWSSMRAAALALPPWELIISSPLERCRAFAEWLAGMQTVECKLEPDLRELDFGDWEGRTAAELMEGQADALGQFWADPYSFTPPNGEPVATFEQRVLGAMERIVRRTADTRALVVTHGGVIRLLLARQQGLPRKDLLQVEVPYASLHAFEASALSDTYPPCCPS